MNFFRNPMLCSCSNCNVFYFLSTRQCQEKSQQQVREFQEYIKQLEEEGDLEIQDIRLQYKQLLTEEKQTNTKLKIESDTTKKSVCVYSCFQPIMVVNYLKKHFTFLLMVHWKTLKSLYKLCLCATVSKCAEGNWKQEPGDWEAEAGRTEAAGSDQITRERHCGSEELSARERWDHTWQGNKHKTFYGSV